MSYDSFHLSHIHKAVVIAEGVLLFGWAGLGYDFSF